MACADGNMFWTVLKKGSGMVKGQRARQDDGQTHKEAQDIQPKWLQKHIHGLKPQKVGKLPECNICARAFEFKG